MHANDVAGIEVAKRSRQIYQLSKTFTITSNAVDRACRRDTEPR
jgi:hypothetical protein